MTDATVKPHDTASTLSGGDAAKTSKPPKRARGASFPTMTLIDAVSMIKKIASYGNSHTDAAVASFLGHSTANSGAYRSKIAALKDYGFLSGRADDLTVTPLALEITHPGLDADTGTSLRAAFFKCGLFQTVYGALPKGSTLQIEALANSAMHNHGVASQVKDTFASVFIKGGVTAGLIEEVDSEHVRLVQGGADAHAETEVEAELAETMEVQTQTLAPRLPVTANALVSHAWPITGGTIRFTIERTAPLPATAYSVIGTVIQAGDQLAAMLTESEAPVVVARDPE